MKNLQGHQATRSSNLSGQWSRAPQRDYLLKSITPRSSSRRIQQYDKGLVTTAGNNSWIKTIHLPPTGCKVFEPKWSETKSSKSRTWSKKGAPRNKQETVEEAFFLSISWETYQAITFFYGYKFKGTWHVSKELWIPRIILFLYKFEWTFFI